MKENVINLNSISKLHEFFGISESKNKLISIIDLSKIQFNPEMRSTKFVLDMYSITLKDENCELVFGRKNMDFKEGLMAFTAPSQILSLFETQKINNSNKGWMLVFHPDLIRKSSLTDKIDEFKFFSYNLEEALHLSNDEQIIVSECVDHIKNEINNKKEYHNNEVLVSIITLLLNLSNRYYERQFNTRSTENDYVVTKVNEILKECYHSGYFAENGIPNVEYLANKIDLSSNYLSDLLKKETGKSAKEYINYFIIEKAKNLLVRNDDTINELAYKLGFNYPHYFSRAFKLKTGMTPKNYKKTH